MTIEDQLTQAFERVDDIDPSDDLWTRVVHSIEEDRRHQRRVRATVLGVAVGLAALVAIGATSLRDGIRGQYVHPVAMVALETAALVALVLMLGPAIRRFGRGYVTDLWPGNSPVPTAILRLLDLAYLMVFAGYILLTTRLELVGDIPLQLELDRRLPDQLEFAAQRIGGLLLLMGALHALTLALLPAVAFIDRATRANVKLPRWMVVVAIIWAVQILPLVPMLIAIGLSD